MTSILLTEKPPQPLSSILTRRTPSQLLCSSVVSPRVMNIPRMWHWTTQPEPHRVLLSITVMHRTLGGSFTSSLSWCANFTDQNQRWSPTDNNTWCSQRDKLPDLSSYCSTVLILSTLKKNHKSVTYLWSLNSGVYWMISCLLLFWVLGNSQRWSDTYSTNNLGTSDCNNPHTVQFPHRAGNVASGIRTRQTSPVW